MHHFSSFNLDLGISLKVSTILQCILGSPSPWQIHAMLPDNFWSILWGSIIMLPTFWNTYDALKCCLLSSLNRCFNQPQTITSHWQLRYDFAVTWVWRACSPNMRRVRCVCRSTFMMLVKQRLTSAHRSPINHPQTRSFQQRKRTLFRSARACVMLR